MQLPIAQFPDIAPPAIQLSATYVGADALTVEQSVATPIEQQMSGVDDMIYMYSMNANDGTMTLNVNFDVGTDPNIDQVLAQMRYSQAESQLPQDVRNYGVTIKQVDHRARSRCSRSTRRTAPTTPSFLANYAYININDPMTRVTGHRPGHGLRRRPVRDAALGAARRAREARHHRPRDHRRDPARRTP